MGKISLGHEDKTCCFFLEKELNLLCCFLKCITKVNCFGSFVFWMKCFCSDYLNYSTYGFYSKKLRRL